MASRHLSRSIALQTLYEWDFSGKDPQSLEKTIEKNIKEFGPGLEDESFVWKLINGIVSKIKEIDEVIKKAAPEWPITQITIVDRNVLRIGLYELMFEDKDEVPQR